MYNKEPSGLLGLMLQNKHTEHLTPPLSLLFYFLRLLLFLPCGVKPRQWSGEHEVFLKVGDGDDDDAEEG